MDPVATWGTCGITGRKHVRPTNHDAGPTGRSERVRTSPAGPAVPWHRRRTGHTELETDVGLHPCDSWQGMGQSWEFQVNVEDRA